MIGMEACTYEKIYFALWEAARRYQDFTQFRVIGNSHDDRMIPMLEVGTGQAVVFCLSGLHGTDRQMPGLLVNMALEYCNAYECGWTLEHFYEVKTLLDEVRLCFIPVLNPDGYEIQAQGYSVIRNPIHRQMLRMKNLPPQEFFYNARGIDLRKNFPTSFMTRKSLLQEPASENETKALIRIFQEYNSLGLLSFCKSEKKLIYFHQPQSFSYNQKSYRLARHLQKCADYHLERHPHFFLWSRITGTVLWRDLPAAGLCPGTDAGRPGYHFFYRFKKKDLLSGSPYPSSGISLLTGRVNDYDLIFNCEKMNGFRIKYIENVKFLCYYNAD